MNPAYSALIFVSASLLSAAPVGLSGGDVLFENNIPSVRSFPTWETLQPSPKTWNHAPAEAFVKTAKLNGTEIIGIFHQLAPWTSSDNTTSGFPLTNRKAWADYVSTLAEKYTTITHWDVLDSYNSGSRQTNTPFHYVELLTAAHDSAKKANPAVEIGFSLANYDLDFLDETLSSGAGKKFDYLSLSPFHFAPGADRQFVTVLPTIRALLVSHGLPGDMPVHITLAGAEKDLLHAAALAQAMGFDRVFIEAGPTLLKEIPEKAPSLPQAVSYEGKDSVVLTFGETNVSTGVFQPVPSTTPWDKENKAGRLPVSGNPPILQTSFLVDPSFISPDDKEIEITLEVSRVPSETGTTNPTGFALIYESTNGTTTSPEWWPVPGENQWHTKTYKLTDASFRGKLGWNFRIEASGAGNDLLIREIVVKK